MSDDGRYDKQYMKPVGEDGRFVLSSMNEHHAPLHDWCLKNMPRSMDGAVLDVGCGGGMMIRKMSEKYPFAMFFGVDISDEAMKLTPEVNAELVASGGLEMHQCSVEDMPFGDGSIDMVTAMETYFFWPDLGKALAEISRVMSAGGVLVIGSEMQVDDDPDFAREALERYGAKTIPNSEMASMMDAAGFDAEVRPLEGSGIVAYIGVKRF